MNNLRRLVVTLFLISVLAVTAFAGITQTPPCTMDPGITQTPPCAIAQPATDDTTDPGEQNGPPASDSVVSVVEETLLQILMF
jgi:ABC-type transport system substrate-binding protein